MMKTTSALLLALVAVAAQTTGSAADCGSHSECDSGLYCAVDNKCWDCFFCRFMKDTDSITGSCDDAGCDGDSNDGDDSVNDDYSVGEGEAEEEEEEEEEATTTTTAAPTTTTTAAPETTTTKKKQAAESLPFYCDPQNPEASTEPDCECPAGCSGGSCKQKGKKEGNIVCDTCKSSHVKVPLLNVCSKQYSCQGGKMLAPPKYEGEDCGCQDKHCNKCVTTAAGEKCKACKNGRYLFDGTCYDSCDDVG